MPSGSRALFTFSWVSRPETAHGLSTISFNNSDLSPAKVTFRVGISKVFFYESEGLRPAVLWFENHQQVPPIPLPIPFLCI